MVDAPVPSLLPPDDPEPPLPASLLVLVEVPDVVEVPLEVLDSVPPDPVVDSDVPPDPEQASRSEARDRGSARAMVRPV